MAVLHNEEEFPIPHDFPAVPWWQSLVVLARALLILWNPDSRIYDYLSLEPEPNACTYEHIFLYVFNMQKSRWGTAVLSILKEAGTSVYSALIKKRSFTLVDYDITEKSSESGPWDDNVMLIYTLLLAVLWNDRPNKFIAHNKCAYCTEWKSMNEWMNEWTVPSVELVA